MRRSILLSVALAATTVTAAGCGSRVTMTDDLDLTWDFALTPTYFDEDLHTPYVKGAPVSVYVYSSDEHEDMSAWTVVSGDPSIFRVDAIEHDREGQGLTARGVAVGAGVAALTVKDGRGETVGTGAADVRTPDSVELDAHGMLIIGHDAEAALGEARVVENGTATYLVRYFADGDELHGNGALSATAPAGVEPEPRQSFLFENREWLTLHTTQPTTGGLELYADGDLVRTLPLAVVPATDVDRVEIIAPDESHAKKDTWLVALAQAYDTADRRIFGIDYQWDLDGRTQFGLGDLYRYPYEPGAPSPLTATFGSHQGYAMLHTTGGVVDSSNNIGCSAGGGGVGGAGLAMFGLMGLGLVRRRRR